MTAERMMKEYEGMKRELSVLEIQIERFHGVDERDIISSMLYGHGENTDRVQTSGISDKTAKIAMNYRKVMERENEDWLDFLWERYKRIYEEVDFFEKCIKSLPEELSRLFMDMVQKKLTWDEISDKYCLSRSSLSRHRSSAIKKINEAYSLRDMQKEEFMLS